MNAVFNTEPIQTTSSAVITENKTDSSAASTTAFNLTTLSTFTSSTTLSADFKFGNTSLTLFSSLKVKKKI